VAPGALAFAEKYFLAARCVAGWRSCLKLTLKDADVPDDGSGLPFTKAVKSRHPGARNPFRNNARDSCVREMPYIDASRDVGAFIAPSAIQSVASGTIRVVGTLSGRRCRLVIITPKIVLLRKRGGTLESPGTQHEAKE
jgi:hypothetical protein